MKIRQFTPEELLLLGVILNLMTIHFSESLGEKGIPLLACISLMILLVSWVSTTITVNTKK